MKMEIFEDTDLKKFFEVSDPIKTIYVPYMTAEVYGFGKHIRKYCYYPLRLPLCISTDHGVATEGTILLSEITCDAPVQFYHDRETVRKWNQTFKKPCFTLFSPFVFYRRSNNVIQSPDAKGTLAFPAHTTSVIDDISDIKEYINDLKALPLEFHPISICLHYNDVIKGQHNAFLKHNFRVFTAGSPDDYRFTENFYAILSKFKYTTSNLMMSCLYYSVEMGTPHFLYGKEPLFINSGDTNAVLGKYDVNKFEKVQQVNKLFKGVSNRISLEQKLFVQKGLGIDDGIGRFKMSVIAYLSFIIYFFSHLGFIIKKVFTGKQYKKQILRKT